MRTIIIVEHDGSIRTIESESNIVYECKPVKWKDSVEPPVSEPLFHMTIKFATKEDYSG